MIKWLARIAVCVVSIAVCHAAYAEDVIIDLKGTWTGRVIRHVTPQGFVPFYSGVRIVIEEQNSTAFRGYLVKAERVGMKPGCNSPAR